MSCGVWCWWYWYGIIGVVYFIGGCEIGIVYVCVLYIVGV